MAEYLTTPTNAIVYVLICTQTGVGMWSHSCEGSIIRKLKQHSFNLSVSHGCATCTPWFTTVNIGLILSKHGRVPHSTHRCNNIHTHLHTNRGGSVLSQLRRQYDQKAKAAQLQSVSFLWVCHLHTMVYHGEHMPHPGGGGVLSQLQRQYDQKAKAAQLQSVSFSWVYHLHTMDYHGEHRFYPG
ncbi:hypothetical protein Cgig2_018908 [Carnegiea gigantea]|uniref:Uncharacterized protein n=1 Tax=Carnegiea gigantea TaxID=171969 RepID=A0A9Q1K473_9CARY|nr:hypothetical protein Cgig2_018908 [Carnegiea gigantea]